VIKLYFPPLGLLLFFIWITLFLSNTFANNAEAHKLLESPYNNNTEFESALSIPDHRVSWGLYDHLGGENNVKARFYKFDNKEINSSFYAHLSIPKIEKYLNFTPSFALIGSVTKNNSSDAFTKSADPVNRNLANNYGVNSSNDVPRGYQILMESDYQGKIPSPIFYEPFTQTSYWERQEIRTQLNNLGNYYLVVFNDNNDINMRNINSNDEWKFSLAVGEVEDFSLQDYVILLPYSWLKVKLFFNDYLSIFIALVIVVFFVMLLMLLIILKMRKKMGNTAK
jgi:hypothetical protein